jgi:hypothetical protein
MDGAQAVTCAPFCFQETDPEFPFSPFGYEFHRKVEKARCLGA